MRRSAIIAAALLTLSSRADAQSAAPIRRAVKTWIAEHAIPVGAPSSKPDAREARALVALFRGADVVAFGEAAHGMAEPLAYRNRLVRYLVAHGGLRAVAIETGIAETSAASEYVLGGPGEPRVVVAPLSWVFGRLQANVELVAWLRLWNDAHPSAQVRLYGFDASGGDDQAEYGHARASLDWLGDYLARAGLPPDDALRADIARLAPDFTSSRYRALAPADRAVLAALPGRVADYLAAHRGALARATSADAIAWAEQIAFDAREVAPMLAIWPAQARGINPDILQAVALRERIMAGHALWAAARERGRGPMLLFAANSHLGREDMLALILPGVGRYAPVGADLARALGPRYRVLLTASSMDKAADDPALAEIDRALLGAAPSPALLDIRGAPGWWDAPRTFGAGPTPPNLAPPRRTYDGLLFFERFTPAQTVDGKPLR